MKLKRNFFTQDSLAVAKQLLGKTVVRKHNNKLIAGKIVETESYPGAYDKASHAYSIKPISRDFADNSMYSMFKGFFFDIDEFRENYLARGGKLTNRNRAEYLIGGHVYIYMVYGMYWQFNISTGKTGAPECVLIRALEPIKIEGLKIKMKNSVNGPGKLCEYLKIDKSFYAEDLTKSQKLWIEDRGETIRESDIVRAPRINIDYAGKYWAKKHWRFYIKGNEFVSKIL